MNGRATSNRTKRRALDVVLFAVALASAYAMKRSYSVASAEELRWLLAPTTWLVERITGEPFAREAGAGFVAERLPLVIAPACAGVNFLIASFLTLSFGFVPRLHAITTKLAWLAATPFLACAATLLANTARIAVAVGLERHGIRIPALSHSEAHRALGVVVYLGGLWLSYSLAERLTRRAADAR